MNPLVGYAFHTFACMADMQTAMIKKEIAAGKTVGIRPEVGWWANYPCTCGLRDLLKAEGLDETQLGQADRA